MIIMVANNTGTVAKELAKSGKLGNLFSPKAQRKPISDYWALDNGRYIVWDRYIKPFYDLDIEIFEDNIYEIFWNKKDYIKLLEWSCKQDVKPRWALVPDIVASKKKTVIEWKKFLPLIRKYGFIPAFAVQDGMFPSDVPIEAEVIFVGGTTKWKWETLPMWAKYFDRVHVGKVNGWKQLVQCLDLGVESVDGTGWFRGCKKQLKTLTSYCNDEKISLLDFMESA